MGRRHSIISQRVDKAAADHSGKAFAIRRLELQTRELAKQSQFVGRFYDEREIYRNGRTLANEAKRLAVRRRAIMAGDPAKHRKDYEQ